MSGRLVVLDRAGRAGKRFPLAAGLATLGRAASCDIRVLRPEVSTHHATITVHANQTVVRHVGSGVTLVNGAPVSVHALRHGDELALGGRRLRWEYDRPHTQPRRSKAEGGAPAPVLALPSQPAGGRAARRGTLAAPPRTPDRDLQLALELRHRASMPASSTGGKQVAIVQPQRRDTSQNESSPRAAARPSPGAGAPSAMDSPAAPAAVDSPQALADDQPKRKLSHSARLHTPTKATLWIESRRGRARAASLRHATPLRLAVLRRATKPRSASAKIQAPTEIDPTKQAAIMLMTGHTARSSLPARAGRGAAPSFRPQRRSPLAARAPRSLRGTPGGPTQHSVSILEITDSDAGSIRRTRHSPGVSPALPSSGPRKSALKDPRRGARKTESIKFDLSNLDSSGSVATGDESDVLMSKTHSDEEITLRYSESPPTPSPRRSLHSRSARMLEQLGSTPPRVSSAPPSPASPRGRQSTRGSIIVQKALDTSVSESRVSRSRRALEAYSIVDLVSDASEYGSPGEGSGSFATPGGSGASRDTLEPTLLGSSTPLPGSPDSTLIRATPTSPRSKRSRSRLDMTPASPVSMDKTRSPRASVTSPKSKRSRSLFDTSPESMSKSTRSGSKSPAARITPTSPKSKRSRSHLDTPASPESSKSTLLASKRSTRGRNTPSSPAQQSMSTPERTPRASVTSPRFKQSRSRLDTPASPESSKSTQSGSKRSTRGRNTPSSPDVQKSPAISTPERGPRASVTSPKSKRSRSLLDMTPTSPESSKSRHSGSKRSGRNTPASPNAQKSPAISTPERRASPSDPGTPVLNIRGLLNASGVDIAEPPSKRARRSAADKRKTFATRSAPRSTRGTLRSKSLSSAVGQVTPTGVVTLQAEPVKTKHSSAKKSRSRRTIIDTLDDSGLVQQLFNSPVKRKLSQSMSEYSRELTDEPPPRARRSIHNDLQNVAGVKTLFARSPRNRLSDMRGVKEMFAPPPRDDLRRVTGVRSLFSDQPHDDLTDVRGVRALFTRAPKDELEQVSPVKEGLRLKSPKNDLRDVRGVKRLYRQPRESRSPNVSGVARLFDESTTEVATDRPRVKSVYSKSFTARSAKKPAKRRRTSSLKITAEAVAGSVEQWLQARQNKSVSRALKQLSTSTIAGAAPLRASRSRAADHTLPIKKRSLVDASHDQSTARSSDASRLHLPLKKRALVHSTPLRGAAPRASAGPGAASPIAPLRTAPQSPKVSEPPEKPKRKRQTKTEIVKEQTDEITKPSPKKTRAKIAREASRVRAARGRGDVPPEPVAYKRGKKAAGNKSSGAKKVISKESTSKQAIEEPVVGRKRGAAAASPAPSRATPSATARATPRATRGRAPRASLVLPRRSPQLKPQPAPRRARKNKTPKESPLDTKQKKSSVKAKKATPSAVKTKKSPKPSTRKTKIKSPKESPVKAKRATRNAPATEAKKAAEPKASKRKIIKQESDPGPKRGRKAVASPKPASTKAESKRGGKPAAQEKVKKVTEPPASEKRARSAKRGADVEPSKDVKKQKGKKAVEAVAESAPRGRKRKIQASAADKKKEPSPKKARGRSAAADKKKEPSPKKPRGRAAAADKKKEPSPKKPRGRAAAADKKQEPSPKKPRGRAAAADKKKEPSPKKPRGRAPAAEKKKAPSPKKPRGRSAAADKKKAPSPKKPRGRSAAADKKKAPSPKKPRGRSAAAAAAPPARSRAPRRR